MENLESANLDEFECHYFKAKVVDNKCQKPRKHKICQECKFNPFFSIWGE